MSASHAHPDGGARRHNLYGLLRMKVALLPSRINLYRSSTRKGTLSETGAESWLRKESVLAVVLARGTRATVWHAPDLIRLVKGS